MYSKRAFVHWYVGEGMEEVGNLIAFTPSQFDFLLGRILGGKRRPRSSRKRLRGSWY